jgi:hypothetical protein
MKSVILLLATCSVLAGACTPPAICKESLGKVRSTDFHKVGTNPANLVVVALDTEPTVGSGLFQSTLDHFGYEYYLLGSVSARAAYPVKNGVFKPHVMSLKSIRFHETIDKIVAERGEDVIILLSDASDVLFTQAPEVVLERFKQLSKDIVLTAELGCCNVNLMPYIEKAAKNLGIDDIHSMDPEVIASVKQITQMMPVLGTSLGYGDEPVYLWTPEAKRIVSLYKKIPVEPHGPATKYRFLNAGGMIGKAGALQKAYAEINFQIFDDEQEKWLLWYGEKGFYDGRAILDYHQSIFAVVNEIEDHDGDMRILFDDFPALPERKSFTYHDDKNGPVVFHCAGCSSAQMRSFRNQIVTKSQSKGDVFSVEQLEFINQC